MNLGDGAEIFPQRARIVHLDACGSLRVIELNLMTSDESDVSASSERVHLEKCKICGEWINRLNLDEVVQHLDHSKRPGPEGGPAQSASLDQAKRQSA